MTVAMRAPADTSAALKWTPRIVALAHGLFLGTFAFDAFEENQNLWRNLLGFLIHLLPTLLEFGALALAWKWKTFGGVLFLLLAGLSFLITGMENALPVYLIVAAPPAIAGVLFIIGEKK
jgi:hypothetical protein